MRQAHELKIFPQFFNAVQSNRKTFEVRKNDRHFRVNDILILKEWDPSTQKYTGRELERHVTYILDNPSFGLQEGYVVMGLKEPRE